MQPLGRCVQYIYCIWRPNILYIKNTIIAVPQFQRGGILCSIGRIYGDRFGTNKGEHIDICIILKSIEESFVLPTNRKVQALFYCRPIESSCFSFLYNQQKRRPVLISTNRKQSHQFSLQPIEKEKLFFYPSNRKRGTIFLPTNRKVGNVFS